MATEVFGNLPKLAETVNKAVSLAKAPPALIAAAFTALPGFASPARAKVLLKKLAAKIRPGEHFPEDYAGNSHRDTYRKATLRCAIRMASLGMVQEADRTLQVVAPQRYGMWLLREAWHIDLLVPFALSAAARCANESRIAEFFDCLPKELWVLVDDVPRPATDEAQQKLLSERLKELEKSKAEAPIEIEERRKKSTLSSSDRYHASEKISDRVMPLLALVRLLTSIIAAPKKTEAHNATLAFLDAWEAAQTNASRRGAYVQREGLRFTDALYKGCAIEMFAALDLAIPNSARRLFSCVERCEVVAPESVICLIRRFAATRSCHSEAGKLAVLAVRLIEREDDVQRRSQLFASLSRALLQANRAESALIFKRGLRDLDAIGSGDYEFANELLHFAATLRDGTLKPELALRLAKICEINVYDSHKWHWPLTARALTSASGAAYLAQIARWHDRDKVDLGLTLPSALTYLVENNVLSSAIGVSLLWLVDPQVLMNWGWHDLVKAMIGRNATEPVLQDVLDQYEHSFPGRSSSHYLNELSQALGTNPKMAAKFAERIKLFTLRGKAPRKVERENRSSASGLSDRNNIRKQDAERQATLTKALADLDPTDAASFESFVEKLETLAGWPYNKSDAYKALRDRVLYGDRAKHIEVIVAARNLELFQKNDLLQAIKDEWTQDSPSQLVVLSGFGLRLVREHAEELLNRKWGFGSDLFKLSELTSIPIDELAIALVEAATTRELNAAAMTWLSIATILSKRADASVPRIALERLLDSGAARLADPIGDGPWRDELDAGADPDNIAAGLLWFRLGSPIAKERWRAAHAVRSVARYKQWDVIERMFALFDAPDAGAFQDRSLPFFGYHAQLWFLLAVARIALDSPEHIARFRPRLEAIAFDDMFPHAGLREAACKALRHCLAGKRDMDAKRLTSRIAKINLSKFPVAKTRNSGARDFPWERPKDVPEPEPRFYFDYDFEKQNIDNLARLFGLPKWRISDLCYEWVRKWAPGVTSMNDFSGRERPSGQRGYYRPTDDAYQSHGTYLAWHALAVVGGQLLLERPITDESYYDDPWQNWLSEYRISRADGYWISDGTSDCPLVALNDLRRGTGSDTERDLPIDDKPFLATLAGLSETLPKDLIVQASWSSPDSVNCSVMSALVPPVDAELSALAVATSPSFHMWLPFYETYDEEEDSRFRRDGMEPCDPWITHAQQSESLDRYDPLGAPSAISIYHPSTLIAAKLQLSATKPWSHAWVDKSGSFALRYEGWGGWQGEGESENRHGGHALYCDRSFLARMLKELDRNLLLLVKLQRYHERKEHGDGVSEEGKFTHSFMVAIIDKQLGAKIIEPTSAQINAVAKLGQYGLHEFGKRLRVLREQPAAKRSLRQRKPRQETS
ncbi:hypothetical protein [Mesorhizobium sp. M0088]|uniref:hypothetical protein n=1 Tax=Mesorhizobium sp. M0088 TaxID=2956873 RepID=UPI003336616E